MKEHPEKSDSLEKRLSQLLSKASVKNVELALKYLRYRAVCIEYTCLGIKLERKPSKTYSIPFLTRDNTYLMQNTFTTT